MELPELTQMQQLIAAGGIAFLLGCLLVRMVFGRSRPAAEEDPRNHQIRELEADLRTVRRELDDTRTELEEKTTEFNTAVETLQDLRSTLNERESETAEMSEELKAAVAKTHELRRELQDRATETVREHVRAEEAETELEIARAGSEAVLSEIARLQEERKHLTDTMQTLSGRVFAEEETESS